jgi:hypothetical protein
MARYIARRPSVRQIRSWVQCFIVYPRDSRTSKPIGIVQTDSEIEIQYILLYGLRKDNRCKTVYSNFFQEYPLEKKLVNHE